MKKSLLLALLFCLLLPVSAAGEEESAYYHIVDENGAYITHYTGVPEAGDEYIAHDNRHYMISRVEEESHTAWAQDKGLYQLPDVKWLQDDSRPVASMRRAVALYCTHSDESYEPSDGDSSVTPRGGIYDVAEALKDNLEDQGITVYYDESTHLPHDSGAYRRSRATAEELVKKGVDAIFDVHRDGIPDPDQYNTTIDGQEASMVRLLVGRSNQNSAANKAFAAEIKAVADQLYPELVRDIYIGKGTYNQDLSPHAVLLEFGTHTVSKERAEQATAFMASAIGKTLYGGVSGAAGNGASQASAQGSRGIWTGIASVLGVAIIGAVVFALASTGGMRPAMEKLRGGMHEMTGGLLNKKNKK
ncbi:MAG: stage II sporulation protein P [Clostridia bacterium]|nr:stage II sporulation protein P [Clostridia bacterium]